MNSLDYLLSFQRFGIKLGLENIAFLLRRLGNPHLDFPAIHITGTNGKGSVTEFIHSALVETGYKVGRYISPHLVDFSERIVVDGIPASASEIDELVDEIRPIVAEMHETPHLGHPTFFEAVTAMAFRYFSCRKVDFAVVEVGMGGRFDSTNVLRPCLSIITNVHLEHRDYLGDTVDRIAVEKAGIIKPGADVVSAAFDPAARKIIDEKAGECGVRVYYLSRDFHVETRPDAFPRQWVDFTSPWRKFENVQINLAGAFQATNAAIALMALEILERNQMISSEENAIRKGLAEAKWPARLERLADSPLILLDGAHNPSGMQSLAESALELFPGQRINLVLGMLSDKDAAECLRLLSRLSDTLIATQPTYERALPVSRLAESARGVFRNVMSEPTISSALQKALALAAPDEIILITGSLFNAAEAKKFVSEKLSEKTRAGALEPDAHRETV